MADSVRKAVLDAALVDVAGIAEIGKTGDSLQSYVELNPEDFPAVFVIDGATVIERSAYPETMTAQMELVCWCFVYDEGNNLGDKRTGLIRDLIVALTSGTMAALSYVNDVVEQAIDTDEGAVPNYSIMTVTFLVTYDYVQSVP